MFDTDDVDEAKRMLPIYKRAVDLLETVSGKKTEQAEPVAWMNDSAPMGVFARHKEGAENFGCTIPLYAAPVRTKDLTDDEIAQAVGSPLDEVYLADFRAVIAAHKEKNRV